MTRNRFFATLTGMMLLTGAAQAEPIRAVVELFTSQGCSSCPPADQLLGELANQPGVMTLAFHVDYWDRLGWKDPFSLREATARQQDYAQKMGLHGVYTPQMVVNGRADVVGSDRRAVRATLDGGSGIYPLSLSISDGKLSIGGDLSGLKEPAEVTLIAYDAQAETSVPRGENAGRTLREYSIVRGIYPAGVWEGPAQPLRFDLTAIQANAMRAAILIQARGHGPILAAGTIALR